MPNDFPHSFNNIVTICKTTKYFIEKAVKWLKLKVRHHVNKSKRKNEKE